MSVTGMSTAVREASRSAHDQPLASFLREPQVVSVGSITGAIGVISGEVQAHGPAPDSALHPHATGAVEAVTLVLIVVLLLAGRAYVCILDARRRMLACAG